MRDRVLLVEDDLKLGKQVVQNLEEHEIEVRWLRDGGEALGENPEAYDLIILDLMLPGSHGMDVLRTYRKTSGVPILILSARNERSDVVRALMLGADDYVTKPFWPEELTARVHARMRRPSLQAEASVEVGELLIDIPRGIATISGVDLVLTRVEFDILAALAQRDGEAVTRRWLVDKVLDTESSGNERTLDVHVSRLRKKLGDYGGTVKTVWRTGYRFERPPVGGGPTSEGAS